MKNNIVHFNSVPMRDIAGNKTLNILGGFNSNELSKYLISEWVSYIECHHCPREDTCKYVVSHPIHIYKKKEIQCGVKSIFIKNTIDVIFDEFNTNDSTKQEFLLSGVYYLSDFVYRTEQQIGMSLSNSYIEYYGEYAPKMMINNIIHLRECLNNAASDIKFTNSLYNKKPIILVEGQSEKFFIEKLKESGLAWFNNLRVETYGGSGNAQPKRIQMQIDGYNEIGYMCFMQGDKDGKQVSQAFNKLVKNKTINKENIFLFKYDFESSIPKEILLKIIQELGFSNRINMNEFETKINKKQSICKSLKQEFDFDIEPLKIKIANKLALRFNNLNFTWYQDHDKFLETTELGKFLDFIIKVHRKT